MKRNFFLMFLLSITSCKSQNTSKPDFAILPPQNSMAGFLGLMEMKRQGFKTNFDKITICIGNGLHQYKKENLILETKMAYAGWMHLSGSFGEKDWANLAFIEDEKCEENAKNYQVAVYINKNNLTEDGEDIFKQSQYTCSRDILNGKYSCNYLNSKLILGYAGVAHVGWSYIGNRWTEITLKKPTRMRLTPYFSFYSLDEEFKNRSDIDPEKKQNFLTLYEKLLNTENQDFNSLVELVKILQSLKLQAKVVSIDLLKDYDDRGFSLELQTAITSRLQEIIKLTKKINTVPLNAIKDIEYNYTYFFNDNKEFDPGAVTLIVNMVKKSLGDVTKYTQINDLILDIGKIGKNEFTNINLPQATAYDVILHEAGHQIGIMHSHEKNPNYVTGTQVSHKVTNPDGTEKIVKEIQIKSTPGDGNAPFVTDDAVMSYTGNPHYMSEDDDIPAVKVLAQGTKTFLQRRLAGYADPNIADEMNQIVHQVDAKSVEMPSITIENTVEPVSADN